MISANVFVVYQGGEPSEFGRHLFAYLPRPGDRIKLMNADGTADTDLGVLYITHFAPLDFGSDAREPSLAIYTRDWLGSN